MDDGGAKPRAVTTVACVNVLDHLFTPFMFEIDIDVWRFIAGFRDETLKNHCAQFGGHGGYTKAVADHGICGGAAPLTEDVLAAGELHDVMDGEEIGFVVELFD